MNLLDFYKKLNRIPFLKLAEIDYVEELKDQIFNYGSLSMTPFYTDGNNGLNLDVMPIYDYEDNNRRGSSHRPVNMKLISLYNELSKRDSWPSTSLKQLGNDCPLARKAVDDYIEVPSRTRLSLLRKHENVVWHSHYYLRELEILTEIVLHLPIQTHVDVLAKVRVENNDDAICYQQHFGKGELWYLNTYHYHTFHNNSDVDRYHIWYNCQITTPKGIAINLKLIDMLVQAVNNYNGPYIE